MSCGCTLPTSILTVQRKSRLLPHNFAPGRCPPTLRFNATTLFFGSVQTKMMLQRVAFLLGLQLLVAQARSGPLYPFEDTTLPWSNRTQDLVSRLTIEEIAKFSLAVYGKTPASAERINVKPYRFLNECLRGIVGGNATAFPQSIGISATFR